MMAEVQRNTFVLIIYEHTKVILIMIAIFAIYLRRRLGKALLSAEIPRRKLFSPIKIITYYGLPTNF